ncbi:MAG: type II toxin-antitoxin system VapC family toxin [Planctomycetes bacterium]|nr:type II toxin-antitoxin system VapC family toxin [Planctomycetota bacterium]
MSVVLDASAVLAFLKSEPGAEVVVEHLRRACISTVNLLEVLEKSLHPERRVEKVVRLLRGWQVEFVPFDEHHVNAAISIKEQVGKANVSLGDRACLGLASYRGLPVVTADQLWAKLRLNVEIILIRGELH